jgi:hypothetical protein
VITMPTCRVHGPLPASEFYDGYSGVCKACCCKRVKERRERLLNDPEWVAAERQRCREKAKRQKPSANPGASKRWARKNPLKRRAQVAANNALRSGMLPRRDACECCGRTGVPLQKHHHDYSRPLEVVWLCTACHGLEHRKAA